MQVVVGRIGRAHGIRGEVGVEVRTDEPENRFAVGGSLTLEESGRLLTIRSARPHQGRMLVVFDGVADRTAAESLRGSILTVEVEPTDRPDDPDDFYDHQLVGLDVRTAQGMAVGAVAEVLHLPAQDTLVVRTPEGSEVLVPFVEALVPTVDVAAGHLVVSDVPGLLDPETADQVTENG